MTRLERLEKYVVTDSGMNTDDARWALAMLREAEQLMRHHSCVDKVFPDDPVKCKWCPWLSKLREEA